MDQKEQMIDELKHKQREKKFLKIAATALVFAVIGFVAFQNLPLGNIGNTQTNEEIQADKTIQIANGVRPYRTTITSSGTVEMKNARSQEVKVTFETNDINQELTIPSNQSKVFNASKYNNLPKTNYFNVDNGDTGEIVIQK
ncbi:hypothetical protein [Candidatus Nanohalobium constans]|uniref:Uncharacterized protein n=1 Tax=Candidatus Nanohalobium constans TaxID=2565781 RepID=A0A5Q0UEZ7_9ARCH|nr:hypothetical protein [Candidatus Nanohalobium constans]QGA80162.1 hypothetical protein LC1Nh_0259 [Candidatus Nanohalobium constans]